MAFLIPDEKGLILRKKTFPSWREMQQAIIWDLQLIQPHCVSKLHHYHNLLVLLNKILKYSKPSALPVNHLLYKSSKL